MREAERQEDTAGWLPFVQTFVEAYALGERLTSSSIQTAQNHEPLPIRRSPNRSSRKGPLVILCSPHPDDEALTGSLPLRLLHEQGATIINLAVTLGSNPSRQTARWAELTNSCAVLGFDCRQLNTPATFDLKAREHGRGWQEVILSLAHLFEELNPDLVFFPHAEDHHPAHVATSLLTAEALTHFTSRQRQAVTAIETEYWRPMAKPNLLIGVTMEDLALLLAAVTCHRGEIIRNPYHLTLPARLMDSVRRGTEMVGSTSSTRPTFLFGELHRVSRWQNGRHHPLTKYHTLFGPDQDLSPLLWSR